ncbi:NADP-dependent oxidoreductase [Brevibacterium atlanticum]|uniref:NADP-dependent oxidoreductase n=1 Tax=Brevibacterium atlanticum TaxID=2697563 RepID=UPI00141E35F2|nr:NADP-dependent oxidoreductase [Brevibacterium atlanticum]
MNTETTMSAVSQQTFGSADVLEITELPRPKPRPNEILVRVQAAGLNPTDWKHRSGHGFIDKLPLVLGWDVSGVVEAVGIGVATFKPGDEVFGMLSYPFGLGSHAEYVAAPARFFATKPLTVDHVQAGALPLVSLTAWQALVDNADLQSGQRVLIHAAAGGVGHIAVQIAKARGAYVIGTASAEKHGFLRELGADEVIDYRTEDFAERARDVDAVLDTIGGDTAMRSLHTLRKGGSLVSLIPVGSDDLLREADQLGVRALRMLVDSSRNTLEIVSGLVDDGALRATIAGTFPLTEAAEAHRVGETNRTTGKLVLTMNA